MEIEWWQILLICLTLFGFGVFLGHVSKKPSGAVAKCAGWLVFAILVVIAAGFVFVRFSPDYNFYLVRSDSMKPAINTGDMIITAPVNGQVRPGEIVTYERGEDLVTHRVLSIDGDKLVTKGDAVEDPDPWSVTLSDVRGSYLFRLPYVGYVSNFITTRLGWFLVIILPATALVAFLIKDIFKEAKRLKGGYAY